MVNIRDNLISMLENRIGRKIRYSSISPTIFGSFDVRNVRIVGEDEEAVLAVSRFRVAYSLLDLFRGRFQSIRSVHVDTPVIDFNLERDYDLLRLFEGNGSGPEGSAKSFAEMLPDKLVLRVRNGKFLISTSGDQFEFDMVNLATEIGEKRIVLEVRWVGGLTIARLIGEPVSVRLGMRISGSCGTDLEEGEAVFSVSSITGDAQSSSPVAFGLLMHDGTVNFWKMPDNLPLNFSLAYGINDGSVDAEMRCRDFMLRDFLSFSGGLENARQLLDVVSSGTAAFSRSDEGKLGYSVDMAGAVQADGSLPYRGTAFELRAAGDEAGVHVDSFRLSMPKTADTRSSFYGNVGFAGDVGFNPLAPDGMLSLGSFSLSGVNGVDANILVSSSKGKINFFSETVRMGSVELVALNVLVQPDKNDLGIAVSALRFTDVESHDNVRLGTLSLEGAMHSDSVSRRLDASLRLDSFPMGDLAEMAMPFVNASFFPVPLDVLLHNVSVTTEVFLSTDFVNLLYNAPRVVFASDAGRGFMGLVSLSGTDRRFELSEGRFVFGEEAVLVSCRAEFPGAGDLGFSVNANYRDLWYSVNGAVVRGVSADIRGSYGLDMKLAASGGGYSGHVRADGFPLPFIGESALLSFSARLRYDSPKSWYVNLEHLETLNIASPVGLAQFVITGIANQDGIIFPLMSYSDRFGTLDGKASISWEDDYSRFNGVVSIGQEGEMYRADGNFADGHLDLAVLGSSMRLDRIFASLSNTLADGDIRVSWDSIDSFRAEFNLSSVNGRMLNRQFSASARAVLDDREFSLSGLRFNFAGIDGSVPQFTVNGASGLAETSAELKGVVGGKELEGSFGIEASFKPIRTWVQIGEALQSFSGTANFSRLRYGNSEQPQPFPVSFSRRGGELSVNGGPRNSLRMQMDSDGNFYAGLSNPFPVRGTVAGSIRNNTINARCGDLYIDMGGLFELLPDSPDIYLTGGYVNAAVDIRGSFTDPEFFGYARGTSLRFRIPGFIPQDLRPIPFNVAIEGNEMRFGPVAATVGNGAGTVGGWFRFDRWIPNIFSLDILVPRETPIPYRYDNIGFLAHGDVSGRLDISMENMAMDVTGDLYANNTELSINSDEMIMAQKRDVFAEQKIPVVTNLAISTGPMVEFFYPDSRYPILRATPDMGTKVYLSVDSMTRQFSLTSDVKIRSGEMFYFERSFYIRSGLLVFRENERRFEPRLTARAEVRDRNDEGPVTISMIVDNAPLLSFTARFESTPSLSQMDIFALLGQTMVGSPVQVSENTGVIPAFFSSTVDFLSQLFVVRRLEQQIRNFMRLDMFSVRTQILYNTAAALVETMGLSESSVDRTGKVGNYFDNTTVFIGKYIGQDMFVQSMLSMKYDPNNTSLGGMTFRPDIGIELQNPLFSIRWDFVPTHPENWYVNDNSITLSRSWSF